MKTQLLKRKPFIYLLSLVFLFASCKKEANTSQNDLRDAVSNSEALNVGGIVAQKIFASKNMPLKSTNATEAIDGMFPVGEDTCMYVINYKGHNGFVVLSGDKSSAPVIMYSETGTLNPDSVSDACSAWIGQSRSYIKYNIRNLSKTKKAQMKKVWGDLLSGQTYMLPSENLKSTSVKSAQTVTPPPGYPNHIVTSLTTTIWHQHWPYNANVPLNCGLENAPAGCVAIAMAQIMKYWKYPAKYNWSSMADDAGIGTDNTDLAKMILDVGTSVNIIYGCDGSNALGTSIIPALVNTFGYSSSAIYSGYDFYKVVDNLNQNWPVIMTGFIGSYNYYTGIWPFRNIHTYYTGGHAWVCSGYLMLRTTVNGTAGELDYLWMNWGHQNASSNNGWCLNTGVNFTEGYYNNTFQYCLNTVYNIHP